MEKQTTIVSFCLFLLCIAIFTAVDAAKALDHHHHHHHHHHHPRRNHGFVKLFVFGDSYADTGNRWKFLKEPYGITYPGKPAGRFSDGRVLTDYLASFLGMSSPVSYEERKSVKKSKLKNGMNFAYGGTGVGDTLVSGPNLTTQIDFFQQILEQKIYTKNDIDSSIALVSVGGNDYSAHLAKPGNDSQDLAAFTKTIINQLGVDLKRIHDLGVPKIAVTALEPLGCLPQLTSLLSYQNCSEFANLASSFHNQILGQKVQELAQQTQKSAAFVVLDVYNAFISVLKLPKGRLAFQNPLKPCCVGVSSEYSCGSVDKSGAKKYRICNYPKLSVFWDMVHPSQNGWHAVYSAIKSSLHQLLTE